MKTKGRVLILGAGLMQRPAIVSARRLGFEVYVIDANESAVCVPLADEFCLIDLKNREAIADYAQKLQNTGGLCGVFTAGTDFSASVSFAAERCGLPAHSFEAALNASDKLRMRQRFAEYDVPSPVYYEVTIKSVESFAQSISSDKYPLVVKPADNMGARGCRLVRSKKELIAAVSEAVSYSRSARAIVEEYMDGPEFSIDALVYNGSVTICGFADRHICYPPYFVEMGHTMPSTFNQSDQLQLIEAFVKGVNALGLTCGAAKGDIKLTKRGPMIGEIAARLSGGYMSGWTYPYAADFALTQEVLRIACGEIPEELLARRLPVKVECAGTKVFEIPCKYTCAERAWISIPGRVVSISGLSSVTREQGISDVLPRAVSGCDVIFPQNNVEKCGNVIAIGKMYDISSNRADHAISQIVLRLEAENEKTTAFLQKKTTDDEQLFPPDAYIPPQGGAFVINEACLKPLPFEGSILSVMPDELLPYLDTIYDWNHRTLRHTIELFERLCPIRGTIQAGTFWNACIRGGIQGMLYVADCSADRRRGK